MGKCTGRASEEVAEYRAILEGLRLALQRQPDELVLFTDDHQVVNQLHGVLSPRDPAVQHLNELAHELLWRIPRAQVSYADTEVNRAARRLAEQVLLEERCAEREGQCASSFSGYVRPGRGSKGRRWPASAPRSSPPCEYRWRGRRGRGAVLGQPHPPYRTPKQSSTAPFATREEKSSAFRSSPCMGTR